MSEEKLPDVWKKEREAEEPAELSDSSMGAVKTSLRRVREANFGTERSGVARKLRETETRVVRFMAEDVIFSRVLKVLAKDMGVRVYKEPDLAVLLPVMEAKKLVESFMKNMEGGHAKALQSPFKSSAIGEMILIKNKVEQFVDEWGTKHGPYDASDLAMLPKKYADILISQGSAQRISPY